MLGWLMLGAILLLGIFLSRSRSAIGLAGLMSVLMVMLALVNRKQNRNVFRWLPIIVLVGGLVAVEFGLNRVADRFENLDGGQRTDVLPGIAALSKRFAGTGTGAGSFPVVYEAYEPDEKLGPKIVNHAHNDWAEVWVDAGFLAVLVVVMFGRWCWQRARDLRDDWAGGRPENAQRLVGALIILSLSLHSLLDYPLRTTSLSCVFVLGCILFLPTASSGSRRSGIPAEPQFSS
jgi:O-antigen ligase